MISKTILLTALALIAFAANSVLCRLALGGLQGQVLIDATSFTAIRLFSGAMILSLFILLSRKTTVKTSQGSWSSSLMLFVYASTFSYAYLSLDTGTGALVLFGAVQVTMIIGSLYLGHRLNLGEWVGLIIAFLGFVYLMLPSASTPAWQGFVLMSISGVAWGLYTLKGRSSQAPLCDTGFNFMRSLAFLLVLLVVVLAIGADEYIHVTQQGVLFAVLSGAVASGMGYTLWYMALQDLKPVQAGVLQLLVPIIAAVGGMLFVSEALTMRFVVSASLILGGILLLMRQKD